MTPATRLTSPMRTAILLSATLAGARAQNCYFPNGDVAPDSSPCFPNSSGASVCCPLNWECESNGLCYLEAEDYYGRYSCTDQSWTDSACPQYCTQNGTAYGNEAIQQCSDGSWCCDQDRQQGNCCNKDDAEVIDVPRGSVVASVTQTPNPSSVASTSSSGSSTSSSLAASSSEADSSSSTSSSSSQTPTPVPTTITTQAATTNSQGVATTVVVVSTAINTPPPSSPSPDSEQDHETPSNTPLIAGLAAGIPAAALLAFGLFFLYRRKTANNHKPSEDSTPSSDTSDLKYMYNNTTPSGQPPEIDSYPVAKTGHYSQVSELSGSSPTQTQRSPAVSSLHSPGTGFGFGSVGGGLGQVKEEKEKEQEPVELPSEPVSNNRASYPGYVPYRPSNTSNEDPNRRQSYVAYRPPSGIIDSSGGLATQQEAPSGGKREEDEISPPQSPTSDVDHGRLGGGGLRIVNQ